MDGAVEFFDREVDELIAVEEDADADAVVRLILAAKPASPVGFVGVDGPLSFDDPLELDCNFISTLLKGWMVTAVLSFSACFAFIS